MSIVLYRSDPAQVRAAIESCLCGNVDVDIIVIDNSPNQKLRSLVEEMGVTYIANPRNLGFGVAHNIALRESLGISQYHLVLNPDVRFGPNVLRVVKAFADVNPEVGLVMPQVLYPDNQEQHLCKRLPDPLDLIIRRFGGTYGQKVFKSRIERYLLRDVDLSVPRSVPALSGCFMFLRTDVLRRVGLFDERFFVYMEDVDLCRRVGEISRTVFFPEVSIYHDYRKGSYRDPHLLRHHMISAFRYFQKWGWITDRERERRNRCSPCDESVAV